MNIIHSEKKCLTDIFAVDYFFATLVQSMIFKALQFFEKKLTTLSTISTFLFYTEYTKVELFLKNIFYVILHLASGKCKNS